MHFLSHKFTLHCAVYVCCIVYFIVVYCVFVWILPAKGLRMQIICFAKSSTITFVDYADLVSKARCCCLNSSSHFSLF